MPYNTVYHEDSRHTTMSQPISSTNTKEINNDYSHATSDASRTGIVYRVTLGNI